MPGTDRVARPHPVTGRMSRAARVMLTAIVVGAVTLRVGYVWWASANGVTWIDPDHYLGQGRLLADGHAVEAFRYRGDFLKAPLYTVLLGLCAWFPGRYPENALVAQAVLGGLAAAGLFSLTRRLAGTGIALFSAAAYAAYFPSVVSLVAVRQEQVYIPLLILAFAVLARAIDAGARFGAMSIAGAAFGLAALARSMPLYFVAAAAGAMLFSAGRSGRREAAGLIAGFAAIALPFTLWISHEVGRLVLIENIGSYGLAVLSPDGREYFSGETPTLISTGAFLWHRLAVAPFAYLGELAEIAIGLFRLPGGSWLLELRFLPRASDAWAMKAAAHLTGDLVLVSAMCLAPLGLIARRPTRLAGLLGLWIVVHVTFTALSGYSGHRFRSPLDFALIALAASALAGGWRPLSARRGLLALLVVVPMVLGAARSIGDSLQARAPYGVLEWPEDPRLPPTRVRAHSGFQVMSSEGRILILVARANDEGPNGPWTVGATVDRVPVARISVDAGFSVLSAPYPTPRAFVELDVTDVVPPGTTEPQLLLSTR